MKKNIEYQTWVKVHVAVAFFGSEWVMRYLLQYSSFACHFSMIENPCKDTKVFQRTDRCTSFFLW